MKAVRILIASTLLVFAAAAASAAEPQLIFIVRHAERAAPTPAAGTVPAGGNMTAAPDDPPLSAAGMDRASRLATMLRSADIQHVFATEFLRTRQTAAPTAQAKRLEVVSLPGRDADGLFARLRDAKGNVLIVGHSNTIPDVLRRLGITETVTIADAEYDNLFVVVRAAEGPPALVRLRY